MAQFWAVGGFSQMMLSAEEFQNIIWAPAQPWPVPMLPRSRTLRASPCT